MTIDYPRETLVLETPASLVVRRAAGAVIPLELHRHGPAIDPFARLSIPGADDLLVEVDMGSDDLILHARYSEGAGVGPDARREEGVDPWGEPWTRTFASVRGRVAFAAAPELGQDGPPAIFQPLIHDGLVGTAFLRRHVVTWDVANAELILGRG